MTSTSARLSEIRLLLPQNTARTHKSFKWNKSVQFSCGEHESVLHLICTVDWFLPPDRWLRAAPIRDLLWVLWEQSFLTIMIEQCCQDKINQILIQTVSLELGDFTDEGIRLVNDGNFVFEGEHHVGAESQLYVLVAVDMTGFYSIRGLKPI